MVSSPYKANAKQIIMASYIGMSSVEMPAASSMISSCQKLLMN
jgi:hypothetical protein